MQKNNRRLNQMDNKRFSINVHRLDGKIVSVQSNEQNLPNDIHDKIVKYNNFDKLVDVCIGENVNGTVKVIIDYDMNVDDFDIVGLYKVK